MGTRGRPIQRLWHLNLDAGNKKWRHRHNRRRRRNRAARHHQNIGQRRRWHGDIVQPKGWNKENPELVKEWNNTKDRNLLRPVQNRDGLEIKGGPTKRLSSGRNSGSAVPGGKTVGETRTGTGGNSGLVYNTITIAKSMHGFIDKFWSIVRA